MTDSLDFGGEPDLAFKRPNLRSHLIGLMESGTGIGVELFDVLHMYPTDSGAFVVYFERGEGKGDDEEILSSAASAVDHFLKLREEQELGFDFEI